MTAQSLKWSSQFSVLPVARTPTLKGDKIILPPSALEQLLSAATTIVTSHVNSSDTPFDSYNPYSLAAARQARAETFERQQTLPHPLTFRLVNPENGRAVFAGIREFSAEDAAIGISPFLRESLGLGGNGSKDVDSYSDKVLQPISGDLDRLTVHAQELPKGTYVKLRPLEAGYDPEDWKALLERSLRDNFTTLTNGEIMAITAGKEVYRFLVDELKPNDQAISIVDTDLEVDIEALNEEQARETLKRRMQKSQKAPGTSKGSSAGGTIAIGQQIRGQVLISEYVDYTLEEWDRTQGLEVELEADDPDFELDLFVSPSGPKQRARPREEVYIFSDLSARSTKRVKIDHSNTSLEDAEALCLSVRGSHDIGSAKPDTPMLYNLRIRSTNGASSSAPDTKSSDSAAPNPDDIRCKNCHQLVPKQTMILHENFCLRNNILCPQCSQVFKKSSLSWQNHWHCPHDSFYGYTKSQREHHDSHFHTPQICKDCSHETPSMRDLAQHRTTTCPSKLILCQFCHLIVPQQGPDDPDPSTAEVILSGLTPHELTDGARTTECHLCAKIVRLRDMSTHLRHHDLQRLARPKPRLCRNVNCGRTLDHVAKNGDVRQQQSRSNDLDICDTCFGPLYVNTYDPDGKALRRRVERRYLTQLLTGCGQRWCGNEFCKTARGRLGSGQEGQVTSKEAMEMVKPLLEGLGRDSGMNVYFCTDEGSQRRRALAGMIAAEGGEGSGGKGKGKEKDGDKRGYRLEWCVAALEVEGGDLDRARQWLKDYAPTRAESTK